MKRLLPPLRKYVSFNGRARRREFWPFAVVTVFILLITTVVIPPLGAVLGCLTIIPLSSVAVRRLHDIGRSGTWLIPLIAIPACMAVVFAIGMSIIGILIIAVLGIETSPGQYEDGLRTIESALAWAFVAYFTAMVVMLSWEGSKDRNQFDET